MSPWTSYPLFSSSSARYEPSCPVIPVMSARFTRFLLLSVHARHHISRIPSWLSHSLLCHNGGTSPSLHSRCRGQAGVERRPRLLETVLLPARRRAEHD